MSRRLTVCLLLAVLLRLALIVQAGGCRHDPDNYLPTARSIASGKGFVIKGRPTAYRPPLYPIVLAPLLRFGDDALPFAIGALHIGLGALTIVATDGFARRVTKSETARWAALILTALDPVLAIQAKGVMTETLAAALTALALWGSAVPGPQGAILGGFGFGLSALCRPSLLAGAGLAMLMRPLYEQRSIGRALRDSLLFGFTIVAVLFPWAARNKAALGEYVWTTTHGGYTLALANNPYYYADVLDGPPDAVWTGENQKIWWRGITRATLTMTEPQADRAIRDGAIDFMLDHPEQAARAVRARLGRFWGIAPSGSVYPLPLRLFTAVWTVPFWLLVIDGCLVSGRRPLGWTNAICVVLGLTVVHAFYWTDLRMRAPVVPALAGIAAFSRVFPRLDRRLVRSTAAE